MTFELDTPDIFTARYYRMASHVTYKWSFGSTGLFHFYSILFISHRLLPFYPFSLFSFPYFTLFFYYQLIFFFSTPYSGKSSIGILNGTALHRILLVFNMFEQSVLCLVTVAPVKQWDPQLFMSRTPSLVLFGRCSLVVVGARFWSHCKCWPLTSDDVTAYLSDLNSPHSFFSPLECVQQF